MENITLYCKIYELRGLISSMVDLVNEDERFDNPIIERLDNKINEIVKEIETKGA